MKKLITPVGTSIFTNLMKNNQRIAELYADLEDYLYHDWTDEQGRINGLRDATRSALQHKSHDSAEIESILRIAKDLEENLDVYLLATDTILSVLACELIVEWFKDNEHIHFKVICEDKVVIVDSLENYLDFLVISKLNVNGDDESIQIGFINLIDKVYSILGKNCFFSKGADKDFIINMSGGYKAVIPYLTLIGQLTEIPLHYMYEESDSLIKISQFPLKFDWDLAEQYDFYLNNDYLKQSNFIRDNLEILVKLENSLLIQKINHRYSITALGKLLKTYVEKNRPNANNVTGFLMEYKFLEYFYNNHYENNGIMYSLVTRSQDLSYDGEKSEVDLVLESDDKNNLVLCEVKIYSQVKQEKIIKKANLRIKYYRNQNKNVSEYLLIIHLGEYDRIKNFKEKLGVIQKGIESYNVICRIFYICRSSNYQELADKPLKQADLIEWQETST
jgi:CRISPR/Cas system-associated protein Csm6